MNYNQQGQKKYETNYDKICVMAPVFVPHSSPQIVEEKNDFIFTLFIIWHLLFLL
jgi:hypothetical protein